MQSQDYPVGDGDSARIEGVLTHLRASCSAATTVLIVGDSDDECSWFCQRAIDGFEWHLSVGQADPYFSVRRLFDLENQDSVHNTDRKVVAIGGVQWLPGREQLSLLAALSAIARLRGIAMLIAAERWNAPAPGDGVKRIDLGVFPIDERRRSICLEICSQCLARVREERQFPEQADYGLGVDRLGAATLTRGRFEAESIAERAADIYAHSAESFSDAIVTSMTAAQQLVQKTQPVLLRSVLKGRLHTIDNLAAQLDEVCHLLRGRSLFDSQRLPPVTLRGDCDDWFGELVARWYASIFDAGGPRVKFLGLLELLGRERVIKSTQTSKPFPLLIESLRTWRYHAVAYGASRTKRQIECATSWFRRNCGTVSPRDEHWRRLAGRLTDEAEAYHRDLLEILRRLETNEVLVGDWADYEAGRISQHLFARAAEDVFAELHVPVDVRRFVDKRVDGWRSALVDFDARADLGQQVFACVRESAYMFVSTLAPIQFHDIAASPLVTSKEEAGQLLERARRIYLADRALTKQQLLERVLGPGSPVSEL